MIFEWRRRSCSTSSSSFVMLMALPAVLFSILTTQVMMVTQGLKTRGFHSIQHHSHDVKGLRRCYCLSSSLFFLFFALILTVWVDGIRMPDIYEEREGGPNGALYQQNTQMYQILKNRLNAPSFV